VPVRILLDPKELEAHPLQIGLSMRVDVDTHRRSDERLQRVARQAPAYETQAFNSIDAEAEQVIERIVAENTASPNRGNLAGMNGESAHGGASARR